MFTLNEKDMNLQIGALAFWGGKGEPTAPLPLHETFARGRGSKAGPCRNHLLVTQSLKGLKCNWIRKHKVNRPGVKVGLTK